VDSRGQNLLNTVAAGAPGHASAGDRLRKTPARVPAGYRRNGDGRLQPDPETADRIREVFLRRVQGGSWQQLAAATQRFPRSLTPRSVRSSRRLVRTGSGGLRWPQKTARLRLSKFGFTSNP
jgi:hypothetical protein